MSSTGRTAVHLSIATFLVLAASMIELPGSRVRARSIPPGATAKLGWGIALQSDRAIYNQGDVAGIKIALFNFTDTDLEVRGGAGNPSIGCAQQLQILDENDVVVGRFNTVCGSPGAPGSAARISLSSNDFARAIVSIPLVDLQNNLLPPGFYTLRYRSSLSGPRPQDGGTDRAGLFHGASVPFEIR